MPNKDQIAALRAKLSSRTQRCTPKCPGWAMFDTGSEMDPEICDECWNHVDGAPCDADLECLPEVQKELARAQTIYDDGCESSTYDYPYEAEACSCGCKVFRRCATGSPCEHCCACEDSRPVSFGVGESIYRDVMNELQRADEIGGPAGDDYDILMRAIEHEARSLREKHEADKKAGYRDVQD